MELIQQQAQQLYSQYLDTIFPDSKVKDIVYHRSPNIFESFNKGKYGRGDIHFYKENSSVIKEFGENTYSVILDIKNPRISKENYDREELLTPEENDASINENREYVVFEPSQIHILGSKQDIEGFKEFTDREKTQGQVIQQKSSSKDLIEQQVKLQGLYDLQADIVIPGTIKEGETSLNTVSTIDYVAYDVDGNIAILSNESENKSA